MFNLFRKKNTNDKLGCCFCLEEIKGEVVAIDISFNYQKDRTKPQTLFSDRNCFHEKFVKQLNNSVMFPPGFVEYPNN
jgi:hypothetical protein